MPESAPTRVFLVVVDETPEHRIAVRYAARRAAHTGGRLAMLYVIEPAELQHFRRSRSWRARSGGKRPRSCCSSLCDEISPLAGSMPMHLYPRGPPRDELLR